MGALAGTTILAMKSFGTTFEKSKEAFDTQKLLLEPFDLCYESVFGS